MVFVVADGEGGTAEPGAKVAATPVRAAVRAAAPRQPPHAREAAAARRQRHGPHQD